MTQQELRIKLNSLKHGDHISVNGYDIKKLGTLWVVKKGDHIKKSFDSSLMETAIVKILGENQLTPLTKKETRAIKLKLQQELKIQKKTEKVKAKEQKLSQKKASRKKAEKVQKAKKAGKVQKVDKVKKADKVQPVVKQVVPVIQEAKPVEPKKKIQRNKISFEGLDIITQAVAYLTWFLYFFTDQLETLLGDYTLYAVIGVGIVALLAHYFYSVQLGIKHRVANILVGIVYIALVGAALTFYYGPLTHTDIILNDVLPSLELAIQEPQSLSILSFMLIKWILLFFANKK
jgi:hypothetical protein